mgnify:CR=1 FL=1
MIETPHNPDFLLLRGRGLTSRECEVLHWIAQGKRDPPAWDARPAPTLVGFKRDAVQLIHAATFCRCFSRCMPRFFLGEIGRDVSIERAPHRVRTSMNCQCAARRIGCNGKLVTTILAHIQLAAERDWHSETSAN